MLLKYIYCAPGEESAHAAREACRRVRAVPVSGLRVPECWKVCRSHHTSCGSSGTAAFLCPGNDEAEGLTVYILTGVSTSPGSGI